MPRSLFESYVAADPAVRGLFSLRNPLDVELRCAAERVKTQRVSPEVIAVLRDAVEPLGLSQAQQVNLELLEKGEAVAIVTGQQVGLFGGPLLTLYKAFAALAVARDLTERTGHPTIPIFWLQAEDHRLDEISSVMLPSPLGEMLHLVIDISPEEELRISVHNRVFRDLVRVPLERFIAEVARFPASERVLTALKRHYRAGATWVEAFTGILHEVLGNDGLLFFDPCARKLAPLKRRVFETAFEKRSLIDRLLAERGSELRKLGFEEQVRLIPGSPLFFLHEGGGSGPRFRLKFERDRWNAIGGSLSVTETELKELLQNAPEQFSSSALLRPILQDSLLPTAGYIAGPGETAYLAQTTVLYDLFQVERAIIVPRPRFVILEPKAQKLLDALGLSAEDITDFPDHTLLPKLTAKIRGVQERGDSLREDIFPMLHTLEERLIHELGSVDETLVASVHRTFRKILPLFNGLVERYERALVARDSLNVERLRRLRSLLRPGGEDQERVFSWAYFIARYGEDFTNVLKAGMREPLSGSRHFLYLQ